MTLTYVPTYLCCILFFRHLKIAQNADTRFIFVHSFGNLKTSNLLQEKLADIAVLEQQLTDLCQTNPAAADSDNVKALKARLVTYAVAYAVAYAVTYAVAYVARSQPKESLQWWPTSPRRISYTLILILIAKNYKLSNYLHYLQVSRTKGRAEREEVCTY